MKNFPNSFYWSGTNLNPEFYYVLPAIFFCILTTPAGDNCLIDIKGLV